MSRCSFNGYTAWVYVIYVLEIGVRLRCVWLMFMCGVLKLEVIFEIGNDCRKIRIICSRSIMQSWPLKDWWRDLIESRNTSSCWSLEDGHCFVLLLLLLVGWWIEHKTKGWMNCESYIEDATCLLCLICKKQMYANMCAKTHGTHTKNACNRCQGGSTRILASASLASQSDLRVAGPVPDILFHTNKKDLWRCGTWILQ